jgi:hypothetical protein
MWAMLFVGDAADPAAADAAAAAESEPAAVTTMTKSRIPCRRVILPPSSAVRRRFDTDRRPPLCLNDMQSMLQDAPVVERQVSCPGFSAGHRAGLSGKESLTLGSKLAANNMSVSSADSRSVSFPKTGAS